MTKETETALVVIEPTTALSVFTEAAKVDPILAAIKKAVADFTPDVSTAKGRDEIASMAYKVSQSKTYLERIGKKLADEYKDIPKKIDANRKRIKDELDALRDEVRRPLTEWEDAERARIEKHMGGIRAIKLRLECQDLDSSELTKNIDWLEGMVIDECWEEFAAEAKAAKDASLAKLYAFKAVVLKQEAEAAELARLREEQAKREQADREAKIAKEAAERATREAEEKSAREKAESEARELRARLAQEQAEKAAAQAIADAEAKAKLAVEDERKRQAEAERQKQAEIDRINAEADRRAADLANRNRVHLEIRDYLIAQGIDDDVAATVVSLLSLGCPHVEVRY